MMNTRSAAFATAPDERMNHVKAPFGSPRSRRGRSVSAAGRRLAGQVVVITGASSGIGLLAARQAAAEGASVVLVSRDAAVLDRIAAAIGSDGGRALAVKADVSVESDVEAVVAASVARFGRIDTWVNNAGIAAYSTLVDLPIEVHRRLFETNYWGLVYGSLAAVRHFRSRPGGGRLINIGSVNSDVAIPFLSAYSATKHAVKGFNDALRRELLTSDRDVSVTLIKPSGIATSFPQHARNFLDAEPRVAPPLYAPEIVADAIVHAAAHGPREIVVGAVGPALSIPQALFPRLVDRLLAITVPQLSKSSHPRTLTDNLESPSGGAETHYRYFPGLPVSPYTAAQKHPVMAAAIALAVGAAAWWIAAARSRR
ncbi:SDR family NAD(P)-dependent oxidoreductase [Aurantimonas aggregata]|uniref:SDR family NAD(P)-dependent oxidoreductase n=1 Tax=Aurantimonas aggregata TaxID=2047720 RepID=A0A6L9MM87_9HYPH|nr:SDR family oxidoreductase [Aurantimonas aggregata]NDV88943.1 SDR family NAD(P)-dependent oxidoreductase [Aurantimonas aggregata]